jgi:hypothetical protein
VPALLALRTLCCVRSLSPAVFELRLSTMGRLSPMRPLRGLSPALARHRQGAPAAKRAGQDDQNKSAGVKRGVLTALPAELFLDLAFSGQPVVALMTPGDQVHACALASL